MCKGKIFFISIFVLVVINLLIFGLLNEKRDVVFVRTVYLLENYAGYKQMNEVLETENLKEQIFIDSLKLIYHRKSQSLSIDSANYGHGKGHNNETNLLKLHSEISEREKKLYNTIVEKREALTKGMINQINESIHLFARENNYKMVFGTTSMGNILYGNEALDVTEDVLEWLNNEYRK